MVQGELFAPVLPSEDELTALRKEGLEAGLERAEEAADHAEDVWTAWRDIALEHLREFARMKERFLIEEVRDFAHRSGLPNAPTERAWGAIPRAACKLGIIESTGETEKNARGTPTTIWRSLI